MIVSKIIEPMVPLSF